MTPPITPASDAPTRDAGRRRLWRVLAGLAVIVALVIGGAWLWGRPRSHVHPSSAQTAPKDVVLAYAKALQDRDFAGAASLTHDQRRQEHWWTRNAFSLDITHLGPVTIRDAEHPLTTYGRADGWEQVAEVRTTSTLHNASGAPATDPGMPWTFYLVRHTSTQPWKIIDQGMP